MSSGARSSAIRNSTVRGRSHRTAWQRVLLQSVVLLTLASFASISHAQSEDLGAAASLARQGNFAAALERLKQVLQPETNASLATRAQALDLLSWCHLELRELTEAQRALEHKQRIQEQRLEPKEVQASEAPRLALSRDHFLQWYLLQRLGKQQQAEQLLRRQLLQSVSGAGLCNSDLARYLLGEISAEQLLSLRERNAAWCQSYFAEGTPQLAQFWIAIKESKSEPQQQARLLGFLSTASLQDYRELALARLVFGAELVPLPREQQLLSASSAAPACIARSETNAKFGSGLCVDLPRLRSAL
jgi:hypothetical protein